MNKKLKNTLSIFAIILVAIGIGVGTYYFIQWHQSGQSQKIAAQMKTTDKQSDARVGAEDSVLGGADIPDPSILYNQDKLGDLIFDGRNYALPIIDAKYSFSGMFYAAEPQSNLWPKDPMKESIILASHTTFDYFNNRLPIGFAPLHETNVGDTFTLQQVGKPDRHYIVTGTREVSPYAIPVQSTSDKPELLLYTCVRIAYSLEESMNYPRLLVTCQQIDPPTLAKVN